LLLDIRLNFHLAKKIKHQRTVLVAFLRVPLGIKLASTQKAARAKALKYLNVTIVYL